MDCAELQSYLEKVDNGHDGFHYYRSKCSFSVFSTAEMWLKDINFRITTNYRINHDTNFAVIASIKLFERFWRKMGVLETVYLKKYLFACYSLVMKYMYDAIDYFVKFGKLGKYLLHQNTVEAEYKIMDVLDWKIV